MIRKFILLPILALAALEPTRADVKLAAPFSDHAVLQRDKPLPVWGWTDPGEVVQVSLGASKGEAKAAADGKWMVRLAAQPLSKEPLKLVVSSKGETMTLNDILLGDVWLCSGQSNMDMVLGGCQAPEDVKSADLPLVRQFAVEMNFASSPQKEVKGRWNVCSPQSASGFTAVGFYFARKVHQESGVPIGILKSAVGGTNIECWMSQETLMKTPSLEPFAKMMRDSLELWRKETADRLPAIDAWSTAAKAALRDGKPLPNAPAFPDYPFGEKLFRPRCVTLHNGMISPLMPMALRGALWYQGENNADGNLYVEKTAAKLAAWRKGFENPDLPYYLVQLAGWQKPNEDPAGGEWGPIRDAQRRCLSIPHTGMASAVDLGDAEDIHPRNKADVGERLALWALRNEYGKTDLVASGPLFREMKIEGGRVRLAFDSPGGGLMIARKVGREPAVEDQGARLQRFAISGEDRKWHWAEAVIDGESVVVSSTEVTAPVAVRYAYCSNPAGANLYNRAGLPASPFRTDNW